MVRMSLGDIPEHMEPQALVLNPLWDFSELSLELQVLNYWSPELLRIMKLWALAHKIQGSLVPLDQVSYPNYCTPEVQNSSVRDPIHNNGKWKVESGRWKAIKICFWAHAHYYLTLWKMKYLVEDGIPMMLFPSHSKNPAEDEGWNTKQPSGGWNIKSDGRWKSRKKGISKY